MCHLEIGREDRGAERDRVAREEQPIGLQRFEDVAHGGRPALDRVEVELAGWARLAAHRPHQVFVHDLLVMDEHTVRHGIVVADDRVDKFVNEGIALERELRDREVDHLSQQGGAEHVAVLGKPRVEARSNAVLLWHSAQSRLDVHDTSGFGKGELAEQEEAVTWLGCDPVGIASASVQECRLRGLRDCPWPRRSARS